MDTRTSSILSQSVGTKKKSMRIQTLETAAEPSKYHICEDMDCSSMENSASICQTTTRRVEKVEPRTRIKSANEYVEMMSSDWGREDGVRRRGGGGGE